jgi:hypothetical protein
MTNLTSTTWRAPAMKGRRAVAVLAGGAAAGNRMRPRPRPVRMLITNVTVYDGAAATAKS